MTTKTAEELEREVASTAAELARVRDELATISGRFNAFVQSAPDAILSMSAKDRKIFLFSPAAERIFGYKAEEVIGQNVTVIMPEPYRSEHDKYIDHYERTGEKRIIGTIREVQARRKNGEVFEIDLSVSAAETPIGRVYNAIIRDISARRRAEREIERLHKAEHDVAETLQAAALSMPEKMQGIDFGSFYHSVSEVSHVGGDLYDLFSLEDERIGIVLGDVSGHGIEAAATASLSRNALRSYALYSKTAAEVMMKANTLIEKYTPPGEYVTAFFGVLDLHTGAVECCSAGHPPAIVISRDTAYQLKYPTSPTIGAFPGSRFTDATFTLDKGDTLVLFTDGTFEARNPQGEFFGEERLVHVLAGMGHLSAAEIPQAVYDRVYAFSEGNVSDDVAVVAVTYRGVEEDDG